MTTKPAILAIDQGTTSSRAIMFDLNGRVIAVAQKELPQHFPADGWVEHDPEDIWTDTVAVCRQAASEAAGKGYVPQAIGITNQRETVMLWDRTTGKPVHRAIVWQDRRTAPLCDELREDGQEPLFTEKTGLLLDPYFSGTKIRWLLDHVDGARAAAEQGTLACGTVDTFLIWRLTGGAAHATDATNASRTLLFNLHTQKWDGDLLNTLDIPRTLLPDVFDCAAPYGETRILNGIIDSPVPITGVAGDQQAALVGQACFTPGMMKSTYGTGCFVLLNTGDTPQASDNRLLTTVAYRLNGETTYALEGSIFIAGAAVQWLRDGLGLVENSAETDALARSLPDNGGVYLVPAFTGLGAPWWDADARGALYGLTRDTSRAHIVRATLEAAAYQTHDLMAAMKRDGAALTTLRVDGGMAENDWLMQFLAGVLALPVERPQITETTALGAAMLAGLGAGHWASLDAAASVWRPDTTFNPDMEDTTRTALLDGWSDAVRRTISTSVTPTRI